MLASTGKVASNSGIRVQDLIVLQPTVSAIVRRAEIDRQQQHQSKLP
jgi:hypothetical protein